MALMVIVLLDPAHRSLRSGAVTRAGPVTQGGPVTAVLTPPQAERQLARSRRAADPTSTCAWPRSPPSRSRPLVAPTFQLVDLVLKIALFATLVASYDVVIGYTGIVSFGHAMFFGFGAYAVALAIGRLGAPTYGHLLAGFAVGIAVSATVAVVIGAFSLRVKAIFFAMITLAFAEFALILAVQWSQLTGGEDGLSPVLPGVFAVGWDGGRVLGVAAHRPARHLLRRAGDAACCCSCR